MTAEFAYAALSRLRHRLQRALDDRRSRAELHACPPSELHRIALDVGLSDADLQSLSSSHPGPSELMPRRLERLARPGLSQACPRGDLPGSRKGVRLLQGVAALRA